MHNCFLQLHVFLVDLGSRDPLPRIETVLLSHFDEFDLAEAAFAEDRHGRKVGKGDVGVFVRFGLLLDLHVALVWVGSFWVVVGNVSNQSQNILLFERKNLDFSACLDSGSSLMEI